MPPVDDLEQERPQQDGPQDQRLQHMHQDVLNFIDRLEQDMNEFDQHGQARLVQDQPAAQPNQQLGNGAPELADQRPNQAAERPRRNDWIGGPRPNYRRRNRAPNDNQNDVLNGGRARPRGRLVGIDIVRRYRPARPARLDGAPPQANGARRGRPRRLRDVLEEDEDLTDRISYREVVHYFFVRPEPQQQQHTCQHCGRICQQGNHAAA